MGSEEFLLVVLALILGAEFVNGWTDAPNAITTVVSTRVLALPRAVMLAGIMNILGALSGTAVAITIGKDIVDPSVISLGTVASAMAALIIWSLIAWVFGLPTSESHALVAGLTGAALASAGPEALLWSGWGKVLVGLLFSTFLGFGSAFFVTKIIRKVFAMTPPGITAKTFGYLQILSAGLMAFSHGSNDGQKFIGTFALTLLLGGKMSDLSIPVWVILLCSLVMGAGTAMGGWRIIKTMGVRMVHLTTPQGFAAEASASGTILFASAWGVPLSTTHTIGTAIMGAGAGYRLSLLRRGVIMQIVIAWILTFPICATLSFVFVMLLRAWGIFF